MSSRQVIGLAGLLVGAVVLSGVLYLTLKPTKRTKPKPSTKSHVVVSVSSSQA